MERKVKVWAEFEGRVIAEKEVDIYDDLNFYQNTAIDPYDVDDTLCTYAHDWLRDVIELKFTNVLPED